MEKQQFLVPPSRHRELNIARPSGFTQIPYHSDQLWKFDSTSNTPIYASRRNSQTKNSCVCVLTWGDTRQLHFRKHWKVPSTTSPEESDKLFSVVKTFQLGHMSLFFLHPGDEEPKKRDLDAFLSQFQHGDVKFGVDGTLSCALMLRSVTSSAVVNTMDGKLVPSCKERTMVQCERDTRADAMLANYFRSGNASEDQAYYYNLFLSVKHGLNISNK